MVTCMQNVTPALLLLWNKINPSLRRGSQYPLRVKKRVMKTELVFTKNEALAMIHECSAKDLRLIASHAEEHNYTVEQIIDWLRELADEAEAQVVVVNMRDSPIL